MIRSIKNTAYVAILFLFLVSDISIALAVNTNQERVALIIGNSNYASAPLRNPRNDASDIASVLENQLDFTTHLVLDANQAQMQRAIRDFSQSTKDADVRLFYYAGHGVSIDGSNYMIPVGANIRAADEVQWEAVNTSLLVNVMQKFQTGANVIILDACRDNPLPKTSRSNQVGLERMEAPVGTLILYATAPGQVALDGTGRNGTFTKHLLNSLTAPNVHIGDIALDVRVAVMQETRNKQVPWSESSLTRRIYLAGEKVLEPIATTDKVESEPTTEDGATSESSVAEPEIGVSAASSSADNSPQPAPEQPSLNSQYDQDILQAYIAAAETGDAIAQASLGYIYDVGRSVVEDNLKAHYWYTKAYSQEYWDAAVNLGVMYLNGDGVPVDKEKAHGYFLEAASEGHPVGERNLGVMYQFGDMGLVDYAKARIWFEKAALKGNVDALVDLGDLYSRGLGVSQDDRKAFEWFLQAAELGSADAQSEIGYLYDQGIGIDQDFDQALHWFQLAARQNHPTGTYNLGEMYELGKGTPVNLAEAKRLYKYAAELGSEVAIDALKRLGDSG